MAQLKKYGSNALIAGGSEGLGAAYALALASEGYNLFLIARRQEQLDLISKSIRDKYPVRVVTICCDLSDNKSLDYVIGELGETEIDFLICNAAKPYIGKFEDSSLLDQTEIGRVNVISALQFSHYFGMKMVGRKRGAIVLMSSLAGQRGSPFISTYSASKAFCRVLAEGLWFEWRKKNVDVIACIAGATSTPNFVKSNPKRLGLFEPQVQSPEEVVKECLNKLGKVPSFISGSGNRLASFFMNNFFSRKLAIKVMGNSVKRMYGVPD